MGFICGFCHRAFVALRHDGLLYFADICSGPGAFTEYMYWRRAAYSKETRSFVSTARGWGFTLRVS